MNINLKNYNPSKIKLYQKYYEKKQINSLQINNFEKNNFDILQLVNILKNNQTLSPLPDYKVTVTFENFSTFTEIIFNLKKKIHNSLYKLNLVSNSFPESSWSTDYKNSIHITNNLYSTTTSFTEYLNQHLTTNEVLNYTFLHELGHCIHSKLKKNTTLNFSSNTISPTIQRFLNDSIPFNDLNFLNTTSYNSNVQSNLSQDLNLISHYGMKEGFADCYACIAVMLIYPKKQAEHILKTVLDGRNYADIWNKEFYHSKDSIEQILKIFKNNNDNITNLKDFNSVQQLIELTTSTFIMKKIEQSINKQTDNDHFVNHYFGVLKNKIKPNNCQSLKDMTDYINANYQLNFNTRKENEFFNIGYQSSNKFSPNPHIQSNIYIESITSKITLIREKNNSTKTSHKIEYKL